MTGREHSDSGQPRDALGQRYLEASAQDTRRPADRVRAAVLAHAQMQLAQGARAPDEARAPFDARAPAANQSRWKISLLASIALAGLTGLLVLQFERGTPDEKEVALGQKSASEDTARLPLPLPSPLPSPAAAPESPSTPPPQAATPATTPQAEAPPSAAKPVQPTARESRQVKPAPQPSPTAEPSASPSPSPFPASPPSRSKAESAASLADAPPAASAPAPNPGAESARPDESAAGRAREAAPAPAAAAAPAARAQTPGQKPNGSNADAGRAREENSNAGSRAESSSPNLLNKRDATADAKAAVQQAARNGNIAQLERLLAQGAPFQSVLNAPDDAGRTPLVLAVISGHAAMVQRLLALGANTALVDQSGINALQHARQRGRADIAALIEAAP